MTIAGRLAALFPLLYLVLCGTWVTYSILYPAWYSVLVLAGIVYLIPLFLFRLHGLFFKIEDGDYDLSKKLYNPWWTGHMLQYPFVAFPFLESILHFVPGLYTLWLRAWGSKIGKQVFWTPRTDVIDRNLIEVGDRTLVGHMSIMVSHMVETKSGVPNLVLKKIKIGSKCLIGADSQLGPGAVVPDGTKLKPKARLFWRGEWK